MPWFDHPAYRPVRDQLVGVFKSRAVAFGHLKHVIFLCGGNGSQRRDFLFTFLRQWTPDALVFQADDVWARIASSPFLNVNALAMEGHLADLADAVIVIVESPGTFAELGAFANNEALRKKLIPILDVQYEHAASFINTGPVQWVNADSRFKPAIFVAFDTILLAADHIHERLKRLTPPRQERVDNLAARPKHLLFFIRDILAVIGPVTATHVERYLAAVLGETPPHVLSLLGLAESLDLVKCANIGTTPYYFVRITDEFKPVVQKRFFDLPNERAKVLSVLQTIDTARDALGLFNR